MHFYNRSCCQLSYLFLFMLLHKLVHRETRAAEMFQPCQRSRTKTSIELSTPSSLLTSCWLMQCTQHSCDARTRRTPPSSCPEPKERRDPLQHGVARPVESSTELVSVQVLFDYSGRVGQPERLSGRSNLFGSRGRRSPAEACKRVGTTGPLICRFA